MATPQPADVQAQVSLPARPFTVPAKLANPEQPPSPKSREMLRRAALNGFKAAVALDPGGKEAAARRWPAPSPSPTPRSTPVNAHAFDGITGFKMPIIPFTWGQDQDRAVTAPTPRSSFVSRTNSLLRPGSAQSCQSSQ
ncbi:unnamed protein product, partial [Polarella glacialis]